MKVSVKQNPEKEVTAEVLADAIEAIAAGVRRLRSTRLNDEALVLLIEHATPYTGGKYQKTKVGKAAVKAVLIGIDSLEKTYLKPVKK